MVKKMTNSFHHQIIKTIGQDLEPLGFTKDGVIEAMISKNINLSYLFNGILKEVMIMDLYLNCLLKAVNNIT